LSSDFVVSCTGHGVLAFEVIHAEDLFCTNIYIVRIFVFAFCSFVGVKRLPMILCDIY